MLGDLELLVILSDQTSHLAVLTLIKRIGSEIPNTTDFH
jgi:hypothetical protein